MLAVGSWVIIGLTFYLQLFSIAVGGVMVGVAKISATARFDGEAARTSVPYFDSKCLRYCAACTGC